MLIFSFKKRNPFSSSLLIKKKICHLTDWLWPVVEGPTGQGRQLARNFEI
jgi:hypothetical protein